MVTTALNNFGPYPSFLTMKHQTNGHIHEFGSRTFGKGTWLEVYVPTVYLCYRLCANVYHVINIGMLFILSVFFCTKFLGTIGWLELPFLYLSAYIHDLVELRIKPSGGGFLLDQASSSGNGTDVLFSTASNTDKYKVTAALGSIAKSIHFTGSRAIDRSPFSISVHTLNVEVEEKSKTIYFLCHASLNSNNDIVSPGSSSASYVCCFVTINTTFSQEHTSCVLDFTNFRESTTCSSSAKLPSVLWRQRSGSSIAISYTTFSIFTNEQTRPTTSHLFPNAKCDLPRDTSDVTFTPLPSATIGRSVPDAIREIGKSLLLQIPRRELQTDEEFSVSVRLKRGDDVSEFTLRSSVVARGRGNKREHADEANWTTPIDQTSQAPVHPQNFDLIDRYLIILVHYQGCMIFDKITTRCLDAFRCEVPANSYVEFIRVIWPGGLTPVKQNEAHFYASTQNEDSAVPAATTRLRSESGVHNSIWDIFHQSVISQKRNVTEIVARFREDLVKASHSGKHSSATEVYKLLFRVARPPVGAPGRVAPRILWSLVSLSRQNTPDRTVLGSPIVTRLNIESSELKHLAIVIKTSALVNLAALTGQPTRHPVWVYGLTHNAQLIDVTNRATCHTGDDAIIHFANDACTKLGFSGAELDGSPGLPLVAKLDGRSATATLLVWFPKAPALRLAVGSIIQTAEDSAGGNIKRVKLKRIKTEITNLKHDVDKLSVWDTADDRDKFSQSGKNQFQHLPVRVLARFILAGSVLYDKDVLGGKIDQYVDVTEFTAHRLRLKSTSIEPADSRVDALTGPVNTEFPLKLVISKNSAVRSLNRLNGTTEGVIQGLTAPNMAWLVGAKPGLVRIFLEPIDQSVTNTHIPPGLAKQLKDQRAQMMAHNGSGLDTDNRPLWINTMDDAPSLEVHVTEEDSIWPVGLSAQLILDFQMVLHQNVDHSLARDNLTSLHGPVLHAAEDLMPLYSSLHAIQFTPIGGQLVHSGTVHDYFTRKDAQIFYRWKPLQPLYQIIRKPLPFKLVVENLRSDVFRIGESVSELRRRRRRRRRSANGWSSGATSYSWMNGMPTEEDTWGARSFSRDNLQYDDNLAKPPESRHSSWFGPTVEVLPNSLPFTGDVLELRLVSQNGQLLVPKLRIPVRITTSGAIKEDVKGAVPVAKRPDQSWLQEGQGKIASLLGVVKPPFSVQPRTYDVAHEQYHVPPFQFSPNRKNIIGDVNHELIALKDAPGFRSIPSATSKQAKLDGKSAESRSANPTQPGALDETSLSDQTRDDKLSMGFTDLRHGYHDIPVSDQEAVRGSRTALELSMYILLGLFALVGLVFAVNCGAVIARYRWERMGRRRDSQIGIAKNDRTSETLNSRSRPASEDAAKSTLCVSSSSEMEPTVEETGVQSLVKRCKQILLPNRTKHKPLLHRDDDWVWISRDKAAASVAQLSSDGVTCLHSPASPPLTTNRTLKNNTISLEGKFSRSHSYGGKRTNTTAVLSIGEADMLLMHSPYRRSAWRENYQSDEAGETSDYSPSITNSALLYQDDGRSVDPWVVAHCGQQQPPESHSAGRPPRRHTTGALMQRNYQNFHALGGVYSTLPQIDDSTETSTATEPHSSTVPEDGDGQHHDRQLLTSNPSEESLWWFHPVRQQRRRRRHHDAAEKAERNLTSGPVHISDRDGGVSEKAHSRETIEYACPALCACDPKTAHIDHRTTGERSVHPPQLRSSHNSPVEAPPEAVAASSPPCKLKHTQISTVTSTSDLAWDRELLALSHDRLMAYFADMKESTA
ncbi:uncharacterized protein DEA37_0004592 [Paragonimus westermani]|uniref:Transmembrane protein family 132 fourth domain-containing protein n=1 Tax=Paragonimus westermani TaxID=34504 RepID=A0A5J4NW89_9TREM|nr:uncharacterized protein DEA37_0004592 [Paragonimus westermani]